MPGINNTVRSYLTESDSHIDKPLCITGRIVRLQCTKNKAFGELTDGSTSDTFKLYFGDMEACRDVLKAPVGSSVQLKGIVVKSPGKHQDVELSVTGGTVISTIRNPETYRYGAMDHKKHLNINEYMKSIRSDTYGRFRSRAMASVMRIRGMVECQLIKCMTEAGFIKFDPPMITASDCEGAGEMFTVTSLPLDGRENPLSFKDDFFKKRMHLTVSGQLEAEAGAQALNAVFTFGPTFRAEHSDTSRHLAEFQMLEPEWVFSDDIDPHQKFMQLLDFEEWLINSAVKFALSNCASELEYINPTQIAFLEKLISAPYARVTYTEAIAILKASRRFEPTNIYWGMDLDSEHERYLCETYYNRPTFVTNYPRDLKSFYMKQNKGEQAGMETVQAVDLLVPGIGELCGGSMREDNADRLLENMDRKSIDLEPYAWYVNLRRDGGLPTGGFGLGFARLIRLITGIDHIRDVTPFPMGYKS